MAQGTAFNRCAPLIAPLRSNRAPPLAIVHPTWPYHGLGEGAQMLDEQLHDRTQSSILQSNDGHWPGTIWQLDWQHFEAEPRGVELHNRSWKRGDEIARRQKVCPQVDGKRGQDDLWHIQAACSKGLLYAQKIPGICRGEQPVRGDQLRELQLATAGPTALQSSSQDKLVLKQDFQVEVVAELRDRRCRDPCNNEVQCSGAQFR